VPSVYERAFGTQLDNLHPRLLPYFTSGAAGEGAGTFSVVGTPRRWLWPMLWVLGKQGVVFSGWERDVPFTVRNIPADGALSAVRRFHFVGGDRDMVDWMSVIDGRLFDELGFRRRYRAELTASVIGGALMMQSRRMTLRIGRSHIPIPGLRVVLTERWDSDADRQQVTVSIVAPVIGLIYEYAGHFDYRQEQRVAAPS
jgi:hypothetical protein